MSETDLEALVKEARSVVEEFDYDDGSDLADAWISRARHLIVSLADALEASIERERRLREALERIASHPRTHSRAHCAGWPHTCMEEAEKVARQALDPGADH